MKRFLKVISLMLALLLSLGLLSSCSNAAERAVELAEKVLAGERYAVDLSFSFECDDEELSSVLDLISDMDMRMTKDGDNASVRTEAAFDILGQTLTVEAEYIAIGNELYEITSASVLGTSETTKRRATMSNTERSEFLGDAGATDVSYTDFGSMSFEKTDAGFKISYTEANGVICDDMEDMMEDMLAEFDAEVSVSNVVLSVVIKDGKYSRATISCDYTVTIDRELTEVHMDSLMVYDYEGIDKIVAPADANSYNEVTYEDIMEN